MSGMRYVRQYRVVWLQIENKFRKFHDAGLENPQRSITKAVQGSSMRLWDRDTRHNTIDVWETRKPRSKECVVRQGAFLNHPFPKSLHVFIQFLRHMV
jgi:hypothetical protein